MSSQEIHLPNLWSIMTTTYDIAAGLDIHKRFIMATILWASGEKIQRRFERTAQGILAIKEWILENKCQVVACESTSDYWVPIYDALCDFVTMIVGNAHDIKVLTHKKTDKIDSENIARLALKDMIKPSRVFTRNHRDFRKLVRLRHFLVRKRTDLKNRIHSILDGELFHLSDSLTDIFGKSGMNILNGILEGKSADEIICTLPPQVRKKKQGDIRALLAQSLSQVALIQLGHCLKVMTRLDEEIDLLTNTAIAYAQDKHARELKILMSVPGIGQISAITLIAEIGNFHDFKSGSNLASWLGLVPNVYQSAGTSRKCSITKRGSRLGRWILIEAAHAASRSRKSALRNFYYSKKSSIGAKKAIVALARKMATIIWHLIFNDEIYKALRQLMWVGLILAVHDGGRSSS